MNYLTKDCFYKSAQTMFRSIQFAVNRKEDNLLPSQLAKHICELKNYQKKIRIFNKKIKILINILKKISIYQNNNQNSDQDLSEKNQLYLSSDFLFEF